MSRKKRIGAMTIFGLLCMLMLYLLGTFRIAMNQGERNADQGVYYSLPKDTSTEDPLEYIREDYTVEESFHTNLPIVILSIDTELTQYKSFKNEMEWVDESAEPYSKGTIRIIASKEKPSYLTDEPVYISHINIKKRGHTSFTFDKSQYLLKMLDADGEENDSEILGMGKGDSWVLNGSMADKSMLRNYLPYRIASDISGGAMAPDSRYCEVLIEKNGVYEYGGVYLLMETVSRGKNRTNIDRFKSKKSYTSYIVRRDRFTNFDVMLDTYGRLNELSPEWIGVKYPSSEKLTEEAKRFIEQDFSKIEKVIYSEKESIFKIYDRYINIDSFVDYFLINEFFGNYDAGAHSTYMYKNSGGHLFIGPVWDFDQAMNNYYQNEMDPYTMAFQTKPFFEQLTKDKRFIDLLRKRYSELRQGALSEEHVVEVMNEAVDYLTAAREREWYRWEADYKDASFANPNNYYLQDYVKDNVIVSRFNDEYEQELYTIRTYLHKHGNVIATELTKLYDLAEYNTSIKNENKLLLLIIMVLFLVPSVLIDRR